MEFVPQKDRNKVKTDDGYPMGYYHRTKAFERPTVIWQNYTPLRKNQ